MARIPAKLQLLLQDFTAALPVILHRNLLGVYLYGSVTNPSFNSKRSDVDCLVVTHRDLSDVEFRKLESWMAEMAKSNPWTERLQVLFLIKGEVLTMDSKACLYQFGVLKRTGSDGNPIIWLDYLRSGKLLIGPPPESFLPEIKNDILVEALKRELGYLHEEISAKPKSEWRDVPMYRAYAVLTVCRILYSFSKGNITSKPRSAKWAIKNLPNRWSGIISQAREYSERGRAPEIPLKRIAELIAFAEMKLH
jgi:predicted nucleotidyltransferase